MANSKLVVVHRRDQNNVGDMAANPLQYFLKDDEYIVLDLSDFKNTKIPSDAKIILGGGGLLSNENFDHIVEFVTNSDYRQLLKLSKSSWTLSNQENSEAHQEFSTKFTELISSTLKTIKNDNTRRIIWGAGHNAEESKRKSLILEYPSYMEKFDIVGVRDHGQRYPYVPCASCMIPALRKKYSVKNDIIWFEHKKQLVKDFGNMSIPRFVNSGNNVDQTIELLGSSNVIITNSYHGVYWGTLLGKKVILADSWSTKFSSFKYKPQLLSKNENLTDAIDKAKIYKESLDESIDATEKFWSKVRSA